MYLCLLTQFLYAEELPTPPLGIEASPIETPLAQEPTQIPILYSGLDEQATLLRVSTASKHAITSLQPITMVDLSAGRPIHMEYNTSNEWLKEPVETCNGSNVSNAHIRQLTQTADNFLSYYDLDKAGNKLKQAEDIVVCLNELFNPDDIRKMYYLRGILEHSKGNNEASIQAFTSAIRIKPDMTWDNKYSPDSKPNFDLAKSRLPSTKMVPLELIPKTSTSSVWINGVPLLDNLNPEIFVGTSIIQIIGLETHTFEIHVPEDSISIRITSPSVMPASAYQWVAVPEQQAELSHVLKTLQPEGSLLYVHDSGAVWQTDVGSDTWTQLTVPKFTEARLNAKKIVAQSVFWTGTTTTVLCFGWGLKNYVEGYSAFQTASSATQWNDYTTNSDRLDSSRGKYRASMIGTAAGVILAGSTFRWAF